MNTNELNDYIKHYIEKDKTQSALMLTAPWGTGKSYYVNNILAPFLNDKCDKKCIIISLYGLKSIEEISKSIFFEAKLKILNKKNVGISAGKILTKTIIKGVASFFGVDLNIDEDELNKLYSSIDLTDKLIILEDVERSQVDILELLGFINNMVEQDGVKILLVANEEEIINKESEFRDDIKIDNVALNDKAKQYLKIKEKTIGDTILFYNLNRDVVKNILNSMNDKFIDKLSDDELIEEIESIMEITKCENLRSLIFACQKTIDMFEMVEHELDSDFCKEVFLGNIAFCFRRKKDDGLKWHGDDESSGDLGTYKYPLYKFSYDYICSQYLDKESIKKANEDYCTYKDRVEKENEITPYKNTIYNFFVSKEKDVYKAIDYITDTLNKTNNITLDEYGKLANYLIAIKYNIGYGDKVDKCKEAMLTNVGETSKNSLDKISLHNGIQLDNDNAIKELNDFIIEIQSKIKANDANKLDFNYTRDKIDDFYNMIYLNKNSFIDKRCFAKKIDNKKFVELLKMCDASDMYTLRQIFYVVYSFSNIKDFFADDKDSLRELKSLMEGLLKSENNFDNVQKMQIRYFIEDLQNFIQRL